MACPVVSEPRTHETAPSNPSRGTTITFTFFVAP